MYNEFYAYCPMDLNSKFKSNAVTKWLGRDLQINTLITIPDPQSVYLARLSSSASSTKSYCPYYYPQTDPTLSFFNPMTAPFSDSESCAFYPSHVSYMNLLFALITLHLTYYDVHLNVPGFCSTLHVTHVMHCDHSDLEP